MTPPTWLDAMAPPANARLLDVWLEVGPDVLSRGHGPSVGGVEDLGPVDAANPDHAEYLEEWGAPPL